MAGIKVIITGATGMVGEGVLFECLQNAAVSEVLIINRRHYEIQHPKLKELLAPDFFRLDDYADKIQGYDACFFCAGVTSVGKKEPEYTKLTYDTTLAFAKVLWQHNNNMVFTYVSGSHTDSTEKGRVMWARVKGKTENDLAKLGFKAEYNFRPGAMLPFEGQRNWKSTYKLLAGIIKVFAPKTVLTMHEVGKAMINCVTIGYHKNILEISDIRQLAKS
ncbi:NAD-dependent epimerase/dehydratase family protein [Parafilimonas sp.]|uniref:NAD-dependent epimerase/dehydratase family protein n=1 Tax=Parafilimonas sp. TaxID=1969739 RepID=UPI0039E3ADED